MIQEETVQFIDAGVADAGGVISAFEPTYNEHCDDIATLGKFLERPVLIDQFTWNEGDVFTMTPHTILPWYLYFNNTYIKSKLANFARLHCNLKLTFRFNASPFYYGSMRVSYDPLASGKFNPLSTEDVVPLSQTPGVYLEPQVTSVAELDLPFLWPHTWLNTGIAAQFQQMGKIIYEPFVALQSANGVTGEGITISTYASACDVEIAGPTTKTLLQSGVVSGPASAIAGFAQKFAGYSAIGPYARAIDIGATAVSRIAKIFGFSNAPVTSNVNPIQNKVFHAFANTETRVPIDKLSIDPANEVTIDNRVTGSTGDDPLIIQSLAGKSSLVKIVSWDTSVVANTVLQYSSVSPYVLRSVTATGQSLDYYTPCGWISEMFRYWRGGMRYTFRVPRSKYHKGRLIVCWDPNTVNTSLGVETAVFSKIFDLSSPDQEFVMDIPFKAASPWLKLKSSTGFHTAAPTPDLSYFNGYLTVGVLNPLTGPTASTSVSVMCFMEAMEDMEFAAPDDLPATTTASAVQSQEIARSVVAECEASSLYDGVTVATSCRARTIVQTEPINGEVMNEQKPEAVIDQSSVKYSERIPDITVGERIGSLRTLLHRTTRSFTQYLGINKDTSTAYGGGQYHTMNLFDRLPPVYGFQTTASYNYGTAVVGTGAKPCNYCATHPINWVLQAFAGYRGSIVVHANVTGSSDVLDMFNMSISRMKSTWYNVATSVSVRNASYQTATLANGAAAISERALTASSGGFPYWPTGASGIVVTNGKTQMAMSAVIPQYARTRFMPAAYAQRNNDFIDDVYDGWRLDADFSVPTAASDVQTWPRADLYWAAGVDFNPVFFTGVPHMYRYAAPTMWYANV